MSPRRSAGARLVVSQPDAARRSTPQSVMVPRRTILLAAALPLAACDAVDLSASQAPTPLPPHPDDVVRQRTVAAERALVAQYMAAAQGHADIATELEQFADRHLRHIVATEATAPPVTPGATPSRAPSTPADAASATPGEDVPADVVDAIRMLRHAETAARADRRADCLAARDGQLAAVLASIAACEATHDRLLRTISP